MSCLRLLPGFLKEADIRQVWGCSRAAQLTSKAFDTGKKEQGGGMGEGGRKGEGKGRGEKKQREGEGRERGR